MEQPSYVVMEESEFTERNKLQLNRLFGLVNDGNLAAYEEIIAEDVIYHGPRAEFRGRKELKKIDASFIVGFPDAAASMEEVIAQGDLIAVRWLWKGTQDGVYLGIEPSHRQVRIDGMHIYRFNEEGKIAEIWSLHDRLKELEQLGQVEEEWKRKLP